VEPTFCFHVGCWQPRFATVTTLLLLCLCSYLRGRTVKNIMADGVMRRDSILLEHTWINISPFSAPYFCSHAPLFLLHHSHRGTFFFHVATSHFLRRLSSSTSRRVHLQPCKIKSPRHRLILSEILLFPTLISLGTSRGGFSARRM